MAPKNRIWQLDAARGLAVILMIVYHFFFDVEYLGIAIGINGPLLILLQRTTAFLFITIAGISLAFFAKDIASIVKRTLSLSFLATLITFATWIYPNKGVIVFGILHFLALSLFLGFFLIPLGKKNVLVSCLVFLTWMFLSGFSISSPWLIWLGFPPADFYTLDYYPLLPWFALVPLGIAIGAHLKRKLKPAFAPRNISFLCFLGRHALIIYMIHQPVLYSLVLLAWF